MIRRKPALWMKAVGIVEIGLATCNSPARRGDRNSWRDVVAVDLGARTGARWA
jgi:hypothetical protein